MPEVTWGGGGGLLKKKKCALLSKKVLILKLLNCTKRTSNSPFESYLVSLKLCFILGIMSFLTLPFRSLNISICYFDGILSTSL